MGQTETRLPAQLQSAFDSTADASVISSLGLWPVIVSTSCSVQARVIPCSNCAQQRHKIIRNGVALLGKESVSGSPAATGRGISQENPPMRIYVIGNDGITLCREPLATVTGGEIAVTSKEELQAAPLSGKRLLALWNALPGVERSEEHTSEL